MNFKKIDRSTIKCYVSNEEMEAYGITVEELMTDKGKARKFINYLLEQARKERLYVLLSGNQRVYQVLIKLYKSYEENGTYSAYISRKDFSEMTGLSERTITRAIKSLVSEGYITKKGWNITMDSSQYQRLKALADAKMSEIDS